MDIFGPADILLPKDCDLSKWSVIACDQYTSEPAYWAKAAEIADGEPSTLNIIFPEVYLNSGDDDKRIASINETMRKYIEDGLFEEYKNSMVYVERKQHNGKVRRGIVGAVDLECYDYSVGSESPIRATEGTILSRIPPRKRIRENAIMELPHIIMLIDDRDRKVVEAVAERSGELSLLYDFDLMLGGGHVTGRLIDEKGIETVMSGIKSLWDDETYCGKYGSQPGGKLIMAVGDGNHSLATAKACWEDIKKGLTEDEKKTHPARYALVELMNLHDPTLEFEAIHRVMFDVDPEAVMAAFKEYYPQMSDEFRGGGQRVTAVYGHTEKKLYISGSACSVSAGTIQQFIDDYIEKHGGSVDYIHGGNVVRMLAFEPNRIGFILDGIRKNELFEGVIHEGALPRKTFSMGEAADKRYYLEARRIR
ncbi:MAG TPA: DUF1015 domain-containing protein [Candidatus Ornithomonoglobus merdipullorum]|uniref:DUF1015 domain-containing protein n=1 Tax=Candidatus Ornithomonoglobus merdipullorum TaxID=2840895 RepID=A0A9D1MCC3_9FIRM|nr:DUF1015 domain-containing protein [Candidatus Ornithomonoglobus merdipullorum]